MSQKQEIAIYLDIASAKAGKLLVEITNDLEGKFSVSGHLPSSCALFFSFFPQ